VAAGTVAQSRGSLLCGLGDREKYPVDGPEQLVTFGRVFPDSGNFGLKTCHRDRNHCKRWQPAPDHVKSTPKYPSDILLCSVVPPQALFRTTTT
jgi:hypothetical protein